MIPRFDIQVPAVLKGLLFSRPTALLGCSRASNSRDLFIWLVILLSNVEEAACVDVTHVHGYYYSDSYQYLKQVFKTE